MCDRMCLYYSIVPYRCVHIRDEAEKRMERKRDISAKKKKNHNSQDLHSESVFVQKYMYIHIHRYNVYVVMEQKPMGTVEMRKRYISIKKQKKKNK